jgi:hypothetical protein
MGLLALGVVGGYGSGIAHLRGACHWREQHRQQVMSEFARTCVDAARTQPGAGQQGAIATPPPPAVQPGAYAVPVVFVAPPR